MFSPISRHLSLIDEIALVRLFKPVRSESLHEKSKKLFPIKFPIIQIDTISIIQIDTISISNALDHKEDTSKIQLYFQNTGPV